MDKANIDTYNSFNKFETKIGQTKNGQTKIGLTKIGLTKIGQTKNCSDKNWPDKNWSDQKTLCSKNAKLKLPFQQLLDLF